MHASFDLNGIVFAVTADDDALLAPLLEYLGEFKADGSPAPDFNLMLERAGERPPPSDADFLAEGFLPNGDPAKSSTRGDTRWVNAPGKASIEFSVEKRTAHISVAAGSEHLLTRGIGAIALRTAINGAGWTFVHSAALRLPQSEQAILLFANSGAGKTTTALALALQGFGYLSDDMTVLMPASTRHPSACMIWGLPRHLRVHRRTKDLLPRLAPLLGNSWNSEDEQLLTRESLRRIVDVCSPRAYRLGAVINLGPRVNSSHVLRKVDKAEMIMRFSSANIGRDPRGGMLTEDLTRFESMAAAIAAVPTFELRVGPELSSIGASILAGLT